MKKENSNEWKEELKDAPFLSKLSGEDPFEAPEGYFDTFSASVVDRINAQKKESWLAKVTLQFRKPLILIPAMAILIFGIIWFSKSKITVDTNEEYISMNYDELYDAALIIDLDESVLCDYIEIESNSNKTTTDEDLMLENLSEEVLINEL
jgi:hypothetical protein